jgi:hypothetical protein
MAVQHTQSVIIAYTRYGPLIGYLSMVKATSPLKDSDDDDLVTLAEGMIQDAVADSDDSDGHTTFTLTPRYNEDGRLNRDWLEAVVAKKTYSDFVRVHEFTWTKNGVWEGVKYQPRQRPTIRQFIIAVVSSASDEENDMEIFSTSPEENATEGDATNILQDIVRKHTGRPSFQFSHEDTQMERPGGLGGYSAWAALEAARGYAPHVVIAMDSFRWFTDMQ